MRLPVAWAGCLPWCVTACRRTRPSCRGRGRRSCAVPDLVWALIFVAAVGLGPFAGVLALTVHSVGMLVRLFAETVEEMDTSAADALVVAGATADLPPSSRV